MKELRHYDEPRRNKDGRTRLIKHRPFLGKINVPPSNSDRETYRRRYQIERGQLTKANGLQ